MDAYMRSLFALALLWLFCIPAAAQFVGTFKPGNIYGNPTGAEAPPIDTPPASLGIVSGPASATALDHACFADSTGKLLADCSGLINYTVLTTTTTVATSNCSQTLYLQGGTQWTLTFPAASSLPDGCLINVINSETNYPVGKSIAGLPVFGNIGGTGSYILYPTVSMRVQVVNGAWAYLQVPKRWVNQNGAVINWYVNSSTGNDVAGVNDGLSPVRAFKTAQQALYTALSTIDCVGGVSETQTVINIAADQNDTTGIHYAPHDLVGCQGGAAVQLVGASLTVNNASNNGSGLCRLSITQTASFSGFISGTTLTVTQMNAGAASNGGSAQIVNGAGISGTGVAGSTFITGFLTGSGGVGTYTVNNSQTVGLTSLVAALNGGTSAFFTNQQVMVYGIGGSLSCNGMFKVTVINATTVDLQGSVFNSGFTGNGTITAGSGFSGGFGIQTYFSAVVELWNLSFINAQIAANYGSQIYVYSGNFFYGTSSAADMVAATNSRILIESPYGIGGAQGGQTSHVQATSYGVVANQSGWYFQPSLGINYALAFAFASQGGYVTYGGTIVTPAGVTVNGKRCEADLQGVTDSGTGSPNTYWPGTSNCTTSLGGQIN